MSTVLITGTSTGFGYLTTELLAGRGWHVFASMRDLAWRQNSSPQRSTCESCWLLRFGGPNLTEPVSS